MQSIRRIAINTGGGDAPGLNAVIRAVTLGALSRGWEVFGIRQGYNGLMQDEGMIHLNRQAVRGITHLGGTILGTTNRGNPFDFPIVEADGTVRYADISDRIVQRFQRFGLDALIAVGGDGSLGIAQRFAEKGIRVVGVPKTIDNDLEATVATFGFDTAVNTAVDALDKLKSTAEAHERVMVVELMGRYAGWIALNSGVASMADVILLPEIPFDIEKVCNKIMERELQGRRFSIVVVAEGAKEVGGDVIDQEGSLGAARKLGGVGEYVAKSIAARTDKECRTLVLGHLQRGGAPTAFDRLLALRLGAAAVRLLAEGQSGVMTALAPPRVIGVPLSDALKRMKTVPIDCDSILTARDLGICLGDQ